MVIIVVHIKPLPHLRANCQWWSRSTTGKTNLISQTIVSLSMDTAHISACQLQGDLHDNHGWNHGDDHEEYEDYQHDCCCRISQTMPTTSCACPDDMKLSKDWRTCIAKNPAKKTSTTTAPVPPKKKPLTTRGTTSRGMKSETTETPILHHGEADVKPVAQEDSRCSLKSCRLYFILGLKIRRHSYKKYPVCER